MFRQILKQQFSLIKFNLNLNCESQTKIHWFNYLTRKLSDLIMNYERDVLKGVSLNISRFNEINILRYENQGHYKPHVDDCVNHHRTLSIILLQGFRYFYYFWIRYIRSCILLCSFFIKRVSRIYFNFSGCRRDYSVYWFSCRLLYSYL